MDFFIFLICMLPAAYCYACWQDQRKRDRLIEKFPQHAAEIQKAYEMEQKRFNDSFKRKR